jgi:hypothetical protein
MDKYTNEALRMQPYLQKGIQSLDDADALEIATAYPEWDKLIGVTVKQGFKFQHKGTLYKTKQPEYTFVEHYEPGTQGTESLFEVINETHAGTIDAPIPYSGNMALEDGKYYSEGGKVYLCTRNTEIPVYNPLSALVGIYVEEVE